MIRLITEQTPKPTFLVLCDNPRCGVYSAQEVPPGLSDQDATVLLLKTLAQLQWSIGLLGHLCPHHASVGRQAEKLISVAHSMPGVLN